MTQNEYREIASAILKNDWDETSNIQAGKFSISQFQGTAFDSDYTCYKVRWSEWASIDNIQLAQRIPYSLVVKIAESSEENILKMLWQNGFPVPKIGAVLRYKNGSVMIFMEMLPGKELYSCTDDDACIACALCAMMCPDCAITVEGGKK
jgi:NAD-dependent dihydropyrimidine dehydrogenase PreA subunit